MIQVRVLFVVIPDRVQLYTVVPLAWALRTAGHDVTLAGRPSFAATIAETGLPAVPVGRHLDFDRTARLTPAQLEEARTGLQTAYDAMTAPGHDSWDDQLYGAQEMLRRRHKPDNFPIIDSLVGFARRWRPDLVLWDPMSYAGPIAAGACGAAHARLLLGQDVIGAARDRFVRLRAEQLPQHRADPLADWLAAYAAKYGFAFTEDMITGHFAIQQLPASLTPDPDPRWLPMRPVGYARRCEVPAWHRVEPDRPRVALLLDQDTVEAQDLGPVDIELGVPLDSTFAAVVHHGSAATLVEAALHGIPQLLLPRHFDEPALSRLLTRQGAGLELEPGASVRDGLKRLLGEPRFGEQATELRREIGAQPPPSQVARLLEELTSQCRAALTTPTRPWWRRR